jgi:hypothetical protein
MKTKDINDLIEIMDQIRRITNTLAEKDMEIRLLRQENERLYKMISEISKPTPSDPTPSDPEPRYRHSWIKDPCYGWPQSPTFTCEKTSGSSLKIH